MKGFWIVETWKRGNVKKAEPRPPSLIASRQSNESKIQNPKSIGPSPLSSSMRAVDPRSRRPSRHHHLQRHGHRAARLQNPRAAGRTGGCTPISNNQRQRRPLEQVEALGFDGLPELDQAEAAISQQDLASGLWPLLKAALRAQGDVQRIWVHARLAQVHDLRGEYVQAAGHVAEVFMISDDVAWRSHKPVSPVNTPTYSAAHEAMENLEAAARRVKSTELQREIETMTRLVQSVHARLAAEYKGPAIQRGSTISGFSREIVASSDKQPADGAAVASQSPVAATPATTREAAPAQPTTSPPATAADSSDPRSPGAIDQLLSVNKASEAVKVCEEIEKNPGDRDLAHFLYQYGKALSQANRKADAAVMLTRCAILYPDSDDAGAALIETALIYRDEFHRADVGRRLLEKVIADAQASGDERSAAVTLARELLGQWPKG